MLDQLVTATIVYPLIIILFVGAAGVSGRFGRRLRGTGRTPGDMTTLTAAALGLLALLIAFSLSHALSRYETRRALIVEEANAIESTANLASMLPPHAQPAILNLLREYVAVRIGLGRPYDPAKLHHDVTKSRELLAKLWQHAAAVSEPQSLPADRFINSLAEMTRVQERRLASMRYNVPNAVLLTLLGLGAVALGFTGAGRASGANVESGFATDYWNEYRRAVSSDVGWPPQTRAQISLTMNTYSHVLPSLQEEAAAK